MRTPITIITGPLGSGKTTLLRHLLNTASGKLAIVMNEFGEIAIDSKIIEGKSIRVAELAGGCVCCSLIGEFEAAVNEIIDTVGPDHIVLEATGVAEPGALVFDIEQNLPRVRLDGVVSVMDADGLLRFPSLGHTTRVQIESADLLLLNKVDLVSECDLPALESKLRQVNETAPILQTQRSQVDPDLLFGLGRDKAVQPPRHLHQLEFDSFGYSSPDTFNRSRFEQFLGTLAPAVYRAKGFIRFPDGTQLFNYVSGRWDFEPFHREGTELVFIGRRITAGKGQILTDLKTCAEPHASRITDRGSYEFLEGLALADVAFRARGRSLEEVFMAAADATMHVMVDNLDSIEFRQQRPLHLENSALDMLLFDLLQELIYHKDVQQLLLRVREVRISKKVDQWTLTGQAQGEKLDPNRHQQRADVKAVTLHHFKVEQTDHGWSATVILDI